jgi:hypothetical protein
MTKSRRMRCAENVARMGAIRNTHSIVVGKLVGKNHSEGLGVDGKIILEWILWKYGVKLWTGCIWLRIRTSGEPL